jgi:hypothetical protein
MTPLQRTRLIREKAIADRSTHSAFKSDDQFLETIPIVKDRTHAPARMPDTTMSGANLLGLYQKQVNARDAIGDTQGVHTIWMRRNQEGDLSAGEYKELNGLPPYARMDTSPMNRWQSIHGT